MKILDKELKKLGVYHHRHNLLECRYCINGIYSIFTGYKPFLLFQIRCHSSLSNDLKAYELPIFHLPTSILSLNFKSKSYFRLEYPKLILDPCFIANKRLYPISYHFYRCIQLLFHTLQLSLVSYCFFVLSTRMFELVIKIEHSRSKCKMNSVYTIDDPRCSVKF